MLVHRSSLARPLFAVAMVVASSRCAIAFFKKLPDGSFETNRISVGLNGLTPPM